MVPGAVNTPLVQSFELVGIDKDDPRVGRLIGAFAKHAAAPEDVAAHILRGIERNRFLVYTSFDTRFGYWWARKFSFPYEFVIRRASDRFSRLLASKGN